MNRGVVLWDCKGNVISWDSPASREKHTALKALLVVYLRVSTDKQTGQCANG